MNPRARYWQRKVAEALSGPGYLAVTPAEYEQVMAAFPLQDPARAPAALVNTGSPSWSLPIVIVDPAVPVDPTAEECEAAAEDQAMIEALLG